jgi:hypothetical protein
MVRVVDSTTQQKKRVLAREVRACAAVTMFCRRAPPSLSSLSMSSGGSGLSLAQKRHRAPHGCTNGILSILVVGRNLESWNGKLQRF